VCRTPKSRAACLALCLVMGVPGFLFPLYYLHLFDNAKWFYEFRSLPLTELSAAGAGLSAGALAGFVQGTKLVSRSFLAIVLSIGIVVPHLKPVVAPVVRGCFMDHWQDGVCLQSTESSCGPASAATVFRTFGIDINERDLAKECYTYAGGTEHWYLARAFRRRGLDVRFRVQKGLPVDLRTPAIAGVRVGRIGHFIVIVAEAGNTYIIGDPLVGRSLVSRDRIEKELNFVGIFMEIGKKPEPKLGRTDRWLVRMLRDGYRWPFRACHARLARRQVFQDSSDERTCFSHSRSDRAGANRETYNGADLAGPVCPRASSDASGECGTPVPLGGAPASRRWSCFARGGFASPRAKAAEDCRTPRPGGHTSPLSSLWIWRPAFLLQVGWVGHALPGPRKRGIVAG
jgi:hypothetical protein